jgi:hypothetical protein
VDQLILSISCVDISEHLQREGAGTVHDAHLNNLRLVEYRYDRGWSGAHAANHFAATAEPERQL